MFHVISDLWKRIDETKLRSVNIKLCEFNPQDGNQSDAVLAPSAELLPAEVMAQDLINLKTRCKFDMGRRSCIIIKTKTNPIPELLKVDFLVFN